MQLQQQPANFYIEVVIKEIIFSFIFVLLILFY